MPRRRMDWTTILAVWALTYAAVVTTVRNLYGDEFMDEWAPVIILALTAPFLLCLHLERDNG